MTKGVKGRTFKPCPSAGGPHFLVTERRPEGNANALYAFKSRGFGGEIGLRDQKETPYKYLVC